MTDLKYMPLVTVGQVTRFRDAALAEIDQLKQGWISVDDRLPLTGQTVFVYCEDYDQIEYINYIGVWPLVVINWVERTQTEAVTHWMPLPLPPHTEGE